MFARTITSKGLESRISRDFFTNQSTSDLIGKAMNIQKNYMEEEFLMASRHGKRCLTLLITKKIKIKMIMG